jgi:hypothetical protein
MGRTDEAKQFTEEQIIGLLKEAGAVVSEPCRKHVM